MMDIDYIAKKLASDDLNRTHLYETEADDFYLVWKCKTLQNWKAVVSTHKCDCLWEITYNGDKKEFYVDRYTQQSNTCVKEDVTCTE